MNNKIMMILSVTICACLISFGVLFYMMWTKISALEVKTTSETEQTTGETGEARKIGPILSLESFIVNLNNPKYKKYLRVTMDLEIDCEESAKIIEERLPQLRDSILSILPTKQFEEVITIDGKNALRADILNTLNSFFDKEIITNIYFSEFIIQ